MPDARTASITSIIFGCSKGSPPTNLTPLGIYDLDKIERSLYIFSGSAIYLGTVGDKWVQPRHDKLQW